MMCDYWDNEIDRICKADKKAWDGKVITTAKQWLFHDGGSASVSQYSYSQIMDAYNESRSYDEWN